MSSPESTPVIDMATYAGLKPRKVGVPREKALEGKVAVIRLVGGIVQGQNNRNGIADKDAIGLLRWAGEHAAEERERGGGRVRQTALVAARGGRTVAPTLADRARPWLVSGARATAATSRLSS